MAGKRFGDILIYILYAAAIVLSLSSMRGGDMLMVEANGCEYAFSLEEDGIYSVTGALGETVIEIKDSKARIVDSPCPNKTCVLSGWSDVLCCLPNRVICTAAGSGGADAVSG